VVSRVIQLLLMWLMSCALVLATLRRQEATYHTSWVFDG
jgi:hypothetical protein